MQRVELVIELLQEMPLLVRRMVKWRSHSARRSRFVEILATPEFVMRWRSVRTGLISVYDSSRAIRGSGGERLAQIPSNA